VRSGAALGFEGIRQVGVFLSAHFVSFADIAGLEEFEKLLASGFAVFDFQGEFELGEVVSVDEEFGALEADASQDSSDFIEEANVVERPRQRDMSKVPGTVILPASASTAGVHIVIGAHSQVIDSAFPRSPKVVIYIGAGNLADGHGFDLFRSENAEGDPGAALQFGGGGGERRARTKHFPCLWLEPSMYTRDIKRADWTPFYGKTEKGRRNSH